ncbi:MAG: hypothetical protein ACK5MF_00450 [Vibrio sp.]|uniref:hypothetical protein n=1 Tax=Vibrio sp. TaxID=678 RepID=UPI003A8C62AD
MSIVRDILELFGETKELSIVENFSLYEAKCTFNSSYSLDNLRDKLEILLTNLHNLGVDLTLTVNTPNPVRILSNNIESLSEKIDSIIEEISFLHSDDVDLELRIDKEEAQNFDVFDVSVFIKYIQSLNLQESLEAWSKFDLSNSLTVNVWENSDYFCTGSIEFKSVYPKYAGPNNSIYVMSHEERSNRIEKRDKCGHFANAAQFNFIPNDFKSVTNNKFGLESYFNGLFNAFLIVYISDFSSISDNTLKYRLKGYKLLSESISFENLVNHNSKELSDIYDWTYLEGNYADKIGLARNIISIHLENETLLSIESGSSDSVQSGYDLYLKDNVKQYIEIKNKISEFILSQSDKALEMTKNMFAMFKTGLWTFTTFFITVFLLRVVNKGTVSGAFSFEVLLVSMLLISISFIYLLISVLEINSDRDRLLGKYSEIRNRYKDLLNEKDLDKILNVTKVSNKEKNILMKKEIDI